MSRDSILRIARAAAHAAYIAAGGPRAFTWCDAFGSAAHVRDVLEAHPLADDQHLYELLVTTERRAATYDAVPLAMRIGLATFRATWLHLQPLLATSSSTTAVPLARTASSR